MTPETMLLINEEIERSKRLHANRTTWPGHADPVRTAGIIVEEAGEAMKAALDLTRPGIDEHGQLADDYMTEILHTAAMAVFALENEVAKRKVRKIQLEKDDAK